MYLLAGLRITQPIFTKFGGKAAHGQMKKQVDFGDNPDPDPGIFEYLTNFTIAVLAIIN